MRPLLRRERLRQRHIHGRIQVRTFIGLADSGEAVPAQAKDLSCLCGLRNLQSQRFPSERLDLHFASEDRRGHWHAHSRVEVTTLQFEAVVRSQPNTKKQIPARAAAATALALTGHADA